MIDTTAPPMCPVCRIVLYATPGAITIQGSAGTYTSHFHVMCPCGWYDFAETANEASDMGTKHTEVHALAALHALATLHADKEGE